MTLTYNLYRHPSKVHRVIRPDTLPIIHEVRQILASDSFLGDGGVVGSFGKHAYARHRGSASTQQTFDQLKGVDRAFFVTLQALELEPKVRPILDQRRVREDADEYHQEHDDYDDYGFAVVRDTDNEHLQSQSREGFQTARQVVLAQMHQDLQHSGNTLVLEYEDGWRRNLEFASFQDRLAFTLSHRTIKGFPLLENRSEADEDTTVDRIGPISGPFGLYPGETHGIDEKYKVSKQALPAYNKSVNLTVSI